MLVAIRAQECHLPLGAKAPHVAKGLFSVDPNAVLTAQKALGPGKELALSERWVHSVHIRENRAS
jgi:hypothetical protein